MSAKDFEVTPHERLVAAHIARQLALALREQAEAVDRIARLATGVGDCGYPDELPYFDSLARTCSVLRNALVAVRTGPQGTIDTPRRIEGTKPASDSGDADG